MHEKKKIDRIVQLQISRKCRAASSERIVTKLGSIVNAINSAKFHDDRLSLKFTRGHNVSVTGRTFLLRCRNRVAKCLTQIKFFVTSRPSIRKKQPPAFQYCKPLKILQDSEDRTSGTLRLPVCKALRSASPLQLLLKFLVSLSHK
jgi:hypothetical protein